MKPYILIVTLWLSLVCASTSARAQTSAPAPDPPSDQSGIKLPDTDKLRLHVRFLAGYGNDMSEERLGLENQGRVGYAIVGLSGRLGQRVTWLFEVNPVHETQPLPSCGENFFFYPNTPQAFGPNVVCDNNGRLRVDDYRFIALDTIEQQGPIRQAYLDWAATGDRPYNDDAPFTVRFGRFILPIGLGVEEAGSFTAKDATHIQRINAEANFGAMFTLRHSRRGQRLFEGHAAAFIGDGNRFHDYDYYYSLDASLDTNSALTALVSGAVHPLPGAEVRAAYKWGYTGSKVEALPNFYASKRNDRALVLSAQYSRTSRAVSLRAFGEYASYWWGPTVTSAEMLGLPTAAIKKDGYYAGGELAYQVTPQVRIGFNVTREELSRDDSQIELLALQGLYGVTMGKKERSWVWRFRADVSRMITVGFYRTTLDNPFPWVSGIVPVAGPDAFTAGRGNNKWGLVVRFAL